MTSLNVLKNMNDPEIRKWLAKVEKAGVTCLVYALLGADEPVKKPRL